MNTILIMRKKIDVFDYSEQIMKALRKGILLNTNGDKFNSMVISWGHPLNGIHYRV